MPYRISRLGIVEIRSLDLDRDLDYYLNVLGLQLTAREGKTAYLKGWDERHAYSVALTEADQPGMVRLAFRTVAQFGNRIAKVPLHCPIDGESSSE